MKNTGISNEGLKRIADKITEDDNLNNNIETYSIGMDISIDRDYTSLSTEEIKEWVVKKLNIPGFKVDKIWIR